MRNSTMARYRGKKALYEVMTKARSKTGNGRTLAQLHTQKTRKDGPIAGHDNAVGQPKAASQWWNKPRAIQFNAGRIELSIPYQIAIALVLGLILLILLAFRLGQYLQPAAQQTIRATEDASANQMNRTRQTNTTMNQPAEQASGSPPAGQASIPARSAGNNVIVLKEYGSKLALVPVQQYFGENGIMTEIVLENDRYFLQTINTYDNPATPGTDGYEARMKIIEVGAKYQAPANYETFAPRFFSDAYGKKVK